MIDGAHVLSGWRTRLQVQPDAETFTVTREELGAVVGYVQARVVSERARCALSFMPTHRHVKRDKPVMLLGQGELQAAQPVEEGTFLVTYAERNGKLWHRPRTEFRDGRFVTLPLEEAFDEDGRV